MSKVANRLLQIIMVIMLDLTLVLFRVLGIVATNLADIDSISYSITDDHHKTSIKHERKPQPQ